jgi:hypothetical protein
MWRAWEEEGNQTVVLIIYYNKLDSLCRGMPPAVAPRQSRASPLLLPRSDVSQSEIEAMEITDAVLNSCYTACRVLYER